MSNLSEIKDYLSKTIKCDSIEYCEGTLVILNPKKSAWEITNIIRDKWNDPSNQVLKEIVVAAFSPAESEGKFLVLIHGEDITKSKDFVDIKSIYEQQNTPRKKTFKEVQTWLDQFPCCKWKKFALILLKNISYFDQEIMRNEILKASGQLNQMAKEKDVYFMRVEGKGNSSDLIIYALSRIIEISGDKIINENDLVAKNKKIIFVDDMIGTGDQAIGYAKKIKKKYNIKQRFGFLAIVGMKEGLENIKESGYFDDPIVLNEVEKVFLKRSVFGPAESGQALTMAKKIGSYLNPKHPLGYMDSQAIIFFDHNTPNNSLPIFWADGEYSFCSTNGKMIIKYKWTPLFPRFETEVPTSKKGRRRDFSETPRGKALAALKILFGASENAELVLKIVEDGQVFFSDKEREHSINIDMNTIDFSNSDG